MNMVVLVYKLTSTFPKNEQYALSSQIQRAAISAPSNIAEGYRRNTQKDRQRFYSIALGSVAEVETQLEIAHRLGYVENISELESLLGELAKMLYSLCGTYPNE